MKGLELSEKYYEKYGKPMLEEKFPDIMDYLAVGLTGSGSECYGYDDETSCDHDFEPGFCIFLPDEETVDRKQAFLLEREYSRLPSEFCGFRRSLVSPVGGNRKGVLRTSDFYLSETGSANGILSVEEWLHIPDYSLAQAVNGKIFFDGYGEVSQIRNYLMNMPRDILLKRIAGNLLIMAQAGQYNYRRCILHGEPDSAQLACYRFVDSAMKVAFLINGKYMPFYKWSFRALRDIIGNSELPDMLSVLINKGNTSEPEIQIKQTVIERISSEFAGKLSEKEIIDSAETDLEKAAYMTNDKIKNVSVRNLHILTAV